MNIGKAIKEVRERKGINQITLSDMVGCTQTHLSQVEGGKKNISIDMTLQVAKALNVPPVSIYFLALDGDDMPESKKWLYAKLRPAIISIVDTLTSND